MYALTWAYAVDTHWRLVAMPRAVARLSSDDIASDAAARLAREVQDARTVTLGGETLDLTDEARSALAKMFELLAAGERVEVVPVAETLTTQQAANVLDVSRPTLVKMLESGLIPYEQPYVHRRISRAAIDEFIASRSERRSSVARHRRYTSSSPCGIV